MLLPQKILQLIHQNLNLRAPKKTNNGPGKFLKIFIKFVKLNFEFLFHTI